MDTIDNTNRPSVTALDSDLLATFVAVVDSDGFTAAGRHLHKTQSTVTLRIRTLEERLNTQLFQRVKQRVLLTADGQTFLVYARRLLQLQQEAVSALGRFNQPIDFRFGIPEDYAETWLPELLYRFNAQYPNIRPHIHCRMSTALIEQLESGELDLVLTVRHSTASTGQKVGTEDLVWAAHRDFDLSPEQSVPLALFPKQCVYRRQALEVLAKAGRDWHIDYTSQSPTGLRIAVDQCRAVTLTGQRTLPSHWRVLSNEAGLPRLNPTELEIHRSPSIQHPAFDAFVDLIVDLLAT